VRRWNANSPEPTRDSSDGGGGTRESRPIVPIASGASFTSARVCSAMKRAMPRSAWCALWAPRTSSQTEPGGMAISVRALGGRDLGGAPLGLERLAGIQQLPQRRQVALDLREALVERPELRAQIGDGFHRGGGEALRLLVHLAQLVVERELEED